MVEDKKISGLTEQSYRTLEELTGSNTPKVLVPVCIENSNYKVDLKTLFGLIYSYIQGLQTNSTFIENIANAIGNSGQTGSGQGSQISNQDLTDITTRLTNAESRLNTLESASTWPTNVITLKNGNTSIDYNLPSNPGGRGYSKGAIVIETTSTIIPNFYVKVVIGTTSVSGTTAEINATVTVYNHFEASLDLRGGTVGVVTLSGSVTMSDGAVYELSGTKTDSTQLPAGSENTRLNSPNSFTLTATVNSGTSISKVTLGSTVSGIAVTKSAERIGGTAIDGEGYIILSNES